VSVPAAPGEPGLAAADVHVVRGAPDEVELAALVAGLVASSSGRHDEPAAPAAWADRRRVLPNPPSPAPGRDTWRWSLHP